MAQPRSTDRLAPLGMGLGQMLLTLAGVAAVLAVLVVVSNSVRAQNADQQTRQTLRSLKAALDQYHSVTESYPPGPCAVAIHHLQRLPASEAAIRGLRFRADAQGFLIVDDGYGRPLRYLEPGAGQAIAPDFVSAGPDGRFGDLLARDIREQQAVTDNLYGRDVLPHAASRP